MFKASQVFYFSQSLRVLYVEDDQSVRESMQSVFEEFFKHTDYAVDGVDGLKYYNKYPYDIVITDINMPHMNGIEMIDKIHEINPEQKIIAISSHDESYILINLIQKGVNGFLLKPVDQHQILNVFYSICRDSHAQNENIILNNALNEERKKLQSKIKEFESQSNATQVKHQQIGDLLEMRIKNKKSHLIEEYFTVDADEGVENVLFTKDDCDELNDLFDERPDLMMQYLTTGNIEKIHDVSRSLIKVSSVLLHYSPFLDTLSTSFSELGVCIRDDLAAFLQLFNHSSENMFMIWDAINLDMKRYLDRFSKESMAMKNIHHIHTPTSLSIQQIIVLIRPQDTNMEEIEFF